MFGGRYTSCYKEGTPTLPERAVERAARSLGTDQEERLIIGSDSGDECRTVTRHGREATGLIGGVMVDVSGGARLGPSCVCDWYNSIIGRKRLCTLLLIL